MALHTIITGGSRILETELITLLLVNSTKTRLISKLPIEIKGVTTVTADPLNYEALVAAIAGSNVVYLGIGIPATTPSWGMDWLTTLRHTINACKECNAKLIYFDEIGINENTIEKDKGIQNSRFVIERQRISQASREMLTEEMNTGFLRAAIGHSVNLYGPGTDTRVGIGLFVFSRLFQGQKPVWVGNTEKVVPLSFSIDIARALYILATNEKSLGKSWCLPISRPFVSGRTIISMATFFMNRSAKYRIVPMWIFRVLNWLFLNSSSYQMRMMQHPFQERTFDSSKFENVFKFKATPYQEGIAITAEYLVKKTDELT